MNSIDNINRNTTETQTLDPRKPMPHIICKEAAPYMERCPSIIPPLLAGVILGIAIGVTLVTYIS